MDTGQSLRLDLADGRSVAVRELVASDEGALRRAFEAADPAVLRSRFGGIVPTFTQIAERLGRLDGVSRYAAGAFDKTGTVVGVAEYVQSRPDGPADVALVVARAWQRQGVGAALLQAVAERALRSGIRTAVALISGSNPHVVELLGSLPVRPDISYDHGAGTVVVDLRQLGGQVFPESGPAGWRGSAPLGASRSGPSTLPVRAPGKDSGRRSRTPRRGRGVQTRRYAMEHILVGVDGTDAGDAALRWALAEAATRDVDLVAVHAWRPPVEADFSWADPSLDVESNSVIQAELVIEQALVRAGRRSPSDAGGPSPSTLRMVALPGPAAQVLEEQARSATLLVLGRRHETVASRALHGSVVSAALHHVDCPVVVVPRDYDAAAVTALPPGRVVVGLSSDEASNGALAWAAEAAALQHRTLVPLLVRPPVGAHRPEPASMTALDASGLRHLTRHVRAVAPEFLGSLQPEVLVGRPGEELSRFVAPHDLLVLGSRGRRPLVGWFLGSASSYVAQHAPCPVVVVRDLP